MAQVYPFRAYRYDPARAPFDRVLTQPYDKISPAMQEKYYAADPHNLITIEKGRIYPEDSPHNNVYTRAASALQDWIRGGILVQDMAPSFYMYAQEFTVPGTDTRLTRRGFIGVGKLEDYSAGIIFRHEHTLSGPKADRLELLLHTRAHTGQLFMLYSDPQKRIDAILEEAAAGSPVTHVCDEYGVTHRLWIIAEAQGVAAIQQAMAEQKLVIADGHHRYETALTYRNECRERAGHVDPEAPYERAMMTFINTHAQGLTILPTHRVASNLHDFSFAAVRRYLEPWFSTRVFSFHEGPKKIEVREKFLVSLAAAREKHAIGVYPAAAPDQRAFYLLTLRHGANLPQLLPHVSSRQYELDVVLLHEGILEPALGITTRAVTTEANLTYERDASAALDAVDRGAAQISFLLNPVTIEQVMRIATAGEVMPQKSTDFYPKLLSGITIYHLD